MSIGIFDSGLGGLTVARAIMRLFPGQKIIYLGDTGRGPYGDKSPKEIFNYSLDNTKFLLKKKAKVIVVGCNSASAVAGQNLRKLFPEVPVLEVVSPAVRQALQITKNGQVGVIGTRATINSGAYQKWFPEIHAQACPLLAPLVEGGNYKKAAVELLTHYLQPLKSAHVDTLILGCTHYPFLKPTIEQVTGYRMQLVDSAETVARELRRVQLSGCSKQKHEFYVSKKTPQFQAMAEKWLGTRIELKGVKL